MKVNVGGYKPVKRGHGGSTCDEFHNPLYNVHCIQHRVKTAVLVDLLGLDQGRIQDMEGTDPIYLVFLKKREVVKLK